MTLSLTDFEYVRREVLERSAIVLGDDKLYLAAARLATLARAEGHPSVQHLIAELRAGSGNGLHQRVVEAIATHETSFFRDLHPFEALRKQILPELIARRAPLRTLNLWCAACASGQEPFSVAMLIREHFPALAGWKVRVLGSDIAADVLERARQGRFSQVEVNRGLPARLLVKYFARVEGGWQIADCIRQMVEFRPINLIGPWPALPPMDVVLLRNVMIYFDLATKQSLLARVRQLLKADGSLFLGAAETTLNIDDRFVRQQLDRAVWYQMAHG